MAFGGGFVVKISGIGEQQKSDFGPLGGPKSQIQEHTPTPTKHKTRTMMPYI